MSEEDERVFIRANKPLLEEYFGYYSDKKRASLLGRIRTTVKLRKAGLDQRCQGLNKINTKILLEKILDQIAENFYDFLENEKQELISEFVNDLCSLNEWPISLPYSFEALNKLKAKWEERLPDATGEG